MIDWFPSTALESADADPARGLARWHGVLNLRRVARALDAKHPATTGHSERVAELAGRIAMDLGWLDWRVDQLRETGRVHDVGKVCIPEPVLMTPGPLTPGEYEVVKTHAALGAQVVATVLSRRQVSWVRHHHERWDGRGYPDGLREEEIPVGSAILAVADAWDAMTHRAWAGEALDEAEAVEECRRESGAQFAPWAVTALERVVGGLPPELAGVRAIAPLQLIPAA